MTDPVSTVTDHALIRYLDRVMGLDVEAVRDRLAADAAPAIAAGACSFSSGGHTLAIRDGRVTTVMIGETAQATRRRKAPQNVRPISGRFK